MQSSPSRQDNAKEENKINGAHPPTIRRKDNSLFSSPSPQDIKAKELLEYVMSSKLEAVETLLKELQQSQPQISFGTLRASGKEKNQRRWLAISPLEFAAGVSGDSKLVSLLLRYILDEHKEQALEQLKSVRLKGTEHGSCLEDYASLIETYFVYINNLFRWSYDELDTHWVKEIAPQQKKLPLYGLEKLFGIKPETVSEEGLESLFNSSLYFPPYTHSPTFGALYKGEFEDVISLKSAFGRDVCVDSERLININIESMILLEEIIKTLEKSLEPTFTRLRG